MPTDAILTDTGGRGAQLPNEQQLDERPRRTELNIQILRDDAVLDEVAKTLAETDEYAAAAHGVSTKYVYRPILDELAYSAQSDPTSNARLNQLLERVRFHMQKRVDRIARDAVAANLEPTVVERIRRDEESAVDVEFRNFSSVLGIGKRTASASAAPATVGPSATAPAPSATVSAAPLTTSVPSPTVTSGPASESMVTRVFEGSPRAAPIGPGTLIIPRGTHSVTEQDTSSVVSATEAPSASSQTGGVNRQNIQQMNEENAWRRVDSVGGWRRMSDAELLAFYNTKRGELQYRAKQELERRGYITPAGGGPNLP